MKQVCVLVVALLSIVSAFRPLGGVYQSTRNTNKSSKLVLFDKNTNLKEDITSNLERDLEGIQEAVAMKETVEAGDTVVCKREISSAGFYEDKSYELQAIFAQRFDPETQTMEKIPLTDLDAPVPNGYDRYVTLFNPTVQEEPVVVTPEEVGLVSVRSEVISAMWLAVPGFGWIVVCFTFYNIYHERTGGTFWDAFFGR